MNKIPAIVYMLLGKEARYVSFSNDFKTVISRNGTKFQRSDGKRIDAPLGSITELKRIY